MTKLGQTLREVRRLRHTALTLFTALTLSALIACHGLVRAQEMAGLQMTVLGPGPTTGGTDHARASGVFVSILVQLTAASHPGIFNVEGYKLSDAAGHIFPITQNALTAMHDLNAGMNGPTIDVRPGFPRQVYLALDVPGPGAYMLSGPGIPGQVPIQAR